MAQPPPLNQQPQIIYVERAPEKKGTSCLTWLAAIILIPILLAFLSAVFFPGKRTPEQQKAYDEMQAKRDEENAMSSIAPGNIKVVKYSWQKGGFGAVMLADVTLKNENSFAVKDITLRTAVVGESGSRLANHDYLATITLKPGQTRTLEGLNFGFIPQQAKSATMDVYDCRLVDPPTLRPSGTK